MAWTCDSAIEERAKKFLESDVLLELASHYRNDPKVVISSMDNDVWDWFGLVSIIIYFKFELLFINYQR